VLEIKDFIHLSRLEKIIEELVEEKSGLVLIAGLDPRPYAQSKSVTSFLPTGRSTIFRILARQMVDNQPGSQCIIVAKNKDVLRISRQQKIKVEWFLLRSEDQYADRIDEAIRLKPDLLVIDQMCAESVVPVMEASCLGIKVLSQFDTLFLGGNVARELVNMGTPYHLLEGLKWILAVQRLPMLCRNCKTDIQPDENQVIEMRQRFAHLPDQWGETFYEAKGCEACQHTGHQGDVTAFDIFRACWESESLFQQSSQLSLSEYALNLASLGYIGLQEALQIDSNQLRRTSHLLSASERALDETTLTLQGKLFELEAANRVLQQRTEALFSLQEVNQALVSAIQMKELAQRVCRHTCELCGADRAILYYLSSDRRAEVLACSGWDPGRVPNEVDAGRILQLEGIRQAQAQTFPEWPPGITPQHPDVEGAALRAGLQVPLLVDDEPLGLMIVHSTYRSEFRPGDVALLQAFANQAALAIQRAGLIEQLQEKILQLEAAQEELVKKERMEQELELARQVQQSVLPKSFPEFQGYQFAARNIPARQVSGDLYDVIQLDDDHLGVMIADVSDKGMPAALYMALTRSLFRAEAGREHSPKKTLMSINQLLLELGEPNMFVSMFYGVIHSVTGKLVYSCAGHNRPFLIKGGHLQELGSEGTILGFFQSGELHLSEEEIDLASGDRLVLYTDGLTDILSPLGKPLELGMLKQILSSNSHLSAKNICTSVFQELIAFQGDTVQYDDMTMLVVEVQVC
jgi:sigma-B regulation protein RsbU (phosphoserine phosphatase)